MAVAMKAGPSGGDQNANFINRQSSVDVNLPDTDDEALTAEFRFRIGMMDDEEDLSEAFKASIGLTGPEAMAETTEVDIALEKQYEATLKDFKFDKFAKKNFRDNQTIHFSREALKSPLLAKREEVDKLASPLLWLAIQRFMGDIPYPQVVNNKVCKVPIMTRIFQALEMHEKRRKSSSSSHEEGGEDDKQFLSFKSSKSGNKGTVSDKRKTWRKIFNKQDSTSGKRLSKTPANSDELTYPTDHASRLDAIPSNELDLIHYIIGHAILRRDLRDEVYCQLCKQLRDNPNKDSCLQGWILMSLCAGCFLPSDQVANYLQSYLRQTRSDFKDYATYTRRILKRTTVNGPRYHPPNWLEYQATKMRKFVLLPIALPDGRMNSIEADSAITASEICNKISSEIELKDNFGFSCFICVYDKVSSLGSGLDHVMDAISECEQLMRSRGKREEDAPWRLYYRKELFVPWHNPEYCSVSTELIYKQICKGIKTEEYKPRAEDEIVRFIARRCYIEDGHEMIPGKLQTNLRDYIPKTMLSGDRSRDGWINAAMASFCEQGFDKKCVPADQVKWHIVVTAPCKWPLQFSGLFEAFRISGPRLPRNDIVIAVSGRGLFILDEPYRVVAAFRYYEIVEVFSSRTHRQHGQAFSIITIKGDEFTFISPNADVVTNLISTFLDGLRQRSICAVGLQEFIFQDASKGSTFQFNQGDVITLLDDKPSREDWVWGVVDLTGAKGEFPIDTVYVLPSMEKPPPDFLQMFRFMSAADVGTLPRKRGAVRLGTSTVSKASSATLDLESAA